MLPSPRVMPLPIAIVRELLAHAERAGAPAEWLRKAADELLASLLELQELREHGRRARTLDRARKAARLNLNGISPAAIAARLGCSRAQVYRHLQLGRRLTLRETVSAQDGGQITEDQP
jgi:hypothetical protein